MALRAGRIYNAELELLDIYARMDLCNENSDRAISHPGRRRDVDEQIAAAIDASMKKPNRLYGWRVQAMFEAVVIALGTVQLIKQEDGGTFYHDDAKGSMSLPDFRIVTAKGETLFVEVKNVAPKERIKSRKQRKGDVDDLRRYADLNGARLVYAHYWSSPNIWTVVDADRFESDSGAADKLLLSFESAFIANEFGKLGDAQIATIPPLQLRVRSTSSGPSFGPSNAREIADEFGVKINGDVEIVAGEKTLTDPVEQRIAMFALMYGAWEHENQELFENGRATGVSVNATPLVAGPQDVQYIAQQGFAIIGFLSAMFSSMYNSLTLTSAGDVRALRHEPDPGMLSRLVPTNYWNRTGRSLPVWKFQIQTQDENITDENSLYRTS
ncbi:hypothetical protein LQL77_19035 [Rhodococcus cerastii]|nr:hypothetical protein [Rhodococcus cerastii]